MGSKKGREERRERRGMAGGQKVSKPKTPKSPETLNTVVKRSSYLGHMLHHDIQDDRYTSSYLTYYCSRILHPLHSQDCRVLKITNK